MPAILLSVVPRLVPFVFPPTTIMAGATVIHDAPILFRISRQLSLRHHPKRPKTLGESCKRLGTLGWEPELPLTYASLF